MKRRTLLKAASMSTLALAWGGGLQLAAAAPGKKTLADAVAAARAAGRPLLVLVFHEDAAWEEGQMYGSLLSHGTDAQLAPLALVEVACASEAQVQALWPALDGKAELVLVPPNGAAPTTATGSFSAAYGPDRDQKSVESRQFSRMDKLAVAVHDLVAACPAKVGTLGDVLKSRDAAPLAAEARTRHHGPAPIGGQWMLANGCGASPERTDGKVALTPPCGMGMVTELGRRFLSLYAE